jgi:hypothetical protein
MIWNQEVCGEALNHSLSAFLYFYGIFCSLMCEEQVK